VQVVDPPVIAAVATLFVMAALLAALLPARRAASIEPMEALRAE
jgi:ABC-type lipoprotein release transport system permease subunit